MHQKTYHRRYIGGPCRLAAANRCSYIGLGPELNNYTMHLKPGVHVAAKPVRCGAVDSETMGRGFELWLCCEIFSFLNIFLLEYFLSFMTEQ